MDHLLARHADCLFWLGRYIERAASLSRVLMVQTAFDRGRAGGAGWAWILALYDESKPFLERYGETSAENVIDYYLADREHGGSIASSIMAARDNARALRAMISTDFWMQINRLHKRVATFDTQARSEKRLAQTCEKLQTDCYALLGTAEATFYRDAGWRFFRMGVEIERADQMSRLLDVRFAQLKTGTADRGEAMGDFAFWSVLLRACGGHHAYRRTVVGPMQPETVARFLIFDQSFARSLGHSVHAIERLANELRSVCYLSTPPSVLERIESLRGLLDLAAQEPGFIGHLHDMNDALQRRLADLTGQLGRTYFKQSDPEEPVAVEEDGAPVDAPAATQTQSQTQSLD
ncbi:MAG: alpha-E domain-containing protein [Pseudomonadota bacterium]